MRKTIELAIDRWRGILTSFGVDESFLTGRHGPCPLCGGKDRFHWDNKNGSGSYFCHTCGPGSGIDLLMKYTGMEFKEAADAIDKRIGNIDAEPQNYKPDTQQNKIRLQKIAKELKFITKGDPVELYLNSRGLSGLACNNLKMHPGLTQVCGQVKPLGKFPAMVASIRNREGKVSSFHITYLNQDGTKAEVENQKKILPSFSRLVGGAIRLFEPMEGSICVAEGVETALAASKMFGLPCWSVCNSRLMEGFEVPDGVNSVFVCADNDSNYTGHKSAYTLANKLSLAGYETDVHLPKKAGTDFADEWLEMKTGQIKTTS